MGWRLNAQPAAAVGTDNQPLKQVDTDRFLNGFDRCPPAGAHRLAALPQIEADEGLVMPFGNLGRCGAEADPLRANTHAAIGDLPDVVYQTSYLYEDALDMSQYRLNELRICPHDW